MSMCRLNTVAKARKSPGTCAICRKTIEAGEAFDELPDLDIGA